MIHVFHHVWDGLECLAVIVVGEDGVLAQLAYDEVPIQTTADDVCWQQTEACPACPLVVDEQYGNEQIEYEDIADTVIVVPYVMACWYGDEEQGDGNRHQFVLFQSQA